jgi:hypothetical protein
MATKKNVIPLGKRFLYTKKEKANSPWELIADTQAIKGMMFTTWAKLSEPYKGNGQPEPIRYGNMPLDFDSKTAPEKALIEMRYLCLTYLPEFYDIDPNEIEFYCSGSKGFHAVIPAEMFGVQNGDPYLPLIYKRIATGWAEKFSLTTIDLSMYAMKRGKMFRLANVRRSNGRYKVPLSLEEVRDLSFEDLWKLSEAPRDVE